MVEPKQQNQISLSMATVISIVAFVLSPVVVYYSAQIATANQISEVKSDVRVLENRTVNLEVRFDRFENKLDALLSANGVNPDKIK